MITRTELLEQCAGPLPPFKKHLRQAIRDDCKTQTRRVMVPQPESVWGYGVPVFTDPGHFCAHVRYPGGHQPDPWVRCPYGKPGEVRYLREPLIRGEADRAFFADDDEYFCQNPLGHYVGWQWKRQTLPQIFMPKGLARTFVRIEQIRVERIQEISEDQNVNDIFEEGLPKHVYYEFVDDEVAGIDIGEALSDFIELWDEINAKRGYGWATNPFVWAIKFSLVSYQGEPSG